VLTSSAGHPGQHLLANLLHFGRLLRHLGLAVSARQIADMARGLTLVDLSRRDDFYHTARAFLVHRPDELDLFDRAFDLFWSGRQRWLLELGTGPQRRSAGPNEEVPPADRRARPDHRIQEDLEEETGDEACADDLALSATYSPWEVLRHRDFASFTQDEMDAAKRCINSLMWRLNERLTRRQVRAAKRSAHLDLPGTVRPSVKHHGEIIDLAWRKPKTRPRPLVVICDISGSMERYSRMLLHFLYAMGQSPQRVETFVFGTRLTRITPALRHKDVDTAINTVSQTVLDWSGGTRIGESLRTFNFKWGRRVLGHGAVAIIISDGWDRGDADILEREISRLRRCVHRLLWLNPLLGAPDYEPLVCGIQTVLPHVDDFLPLHNLHSLEQLSRHLGSLRYEVRSA
jgi:uncharacterized protein with von Willebrand factor type A (vWA) domain